MIAFNDANPALEEPVNFTSQSTYVSGSGNLSLTNVQNASILRRLIQAQATTGRNASFFQSLAFDKELGGARGIDAALSEHGLDALLLPSAGRTTVPAGKMVKVGSF